jgi:hypothetical protein
VGYPDRIVSVSPKVPQMLRARTLTNLYNERPTWLNNAHRDLDVAVAAAYGRPAEIGEEDALGDYSHSTASAPSPGGTRVAPHPGPPPASGEREWPRMLLPRSVRVDDRAQHDAAFLGMIITGAAVHRRPFVPNQQIADLPGNGR